MLLEVICITHFFQGCQVDFVWKTCFSECFRYSSCEWSKSQPRRKFKLSNYPVFEFWTKSFATVSRVCHDLKLTSENFKTQLVGHWAPKIFAIGSSVTDSRNAQNQLFKGYFVVLLFETFPIFSKNLISKFLHQNLTKFNCFQFH